MVSSRKKISIIKLQTASKVLKTIAHPVRLQILNVLEKAEPLDVSTICSKIESDVEISMLSHHLTKMKDNGLLISVKQGKHNLYSITDRNVLKIFDCIESCDAF